jgi:hypothetical protein
VDREVQVEPEGWAVMEARGPTGAMAWLAVAQLASVEVGVKAVTPAQAVTEPTAVKAGTAAMEEA